MEQDILQGQVPYTRPSQQTNSVTVPEFYGKKQYQYIKMQCYSYSYSYTLQRIVLRGIMQCYRLVRKDGFSALIGTVGDC